MSKLTINTDFTTVVVPTDLAASRRLNRELLGLLVTLQAKVAQLEAEIAVLKERLDDSSATSSNPPSRDTPEQRAQRERKPRSALKRGGQPGHSKHERALVEEARLDAIRHYYPEGCCVTVHGLASGII